MKGLSWVVGFLLVAVLGVATWAVIGEGQRVGFRDSPSYLSSAENLADGDGYVTDFGDRGKPVDFDSTTFPVVDFPPGLPFMLSLGIAIGIEGVEASIWLTVAAAAASGLLFYVFALRRTSSIGIALLFGLTAGLATIPTGIGVLSEPLFGFLVAVTVICAGAFLRNPSPWWFAAAGVAAMASITVRTAGLALVGALAVIAWKGFTSLRWRALSSVGILAVGLLVFSSVAGSGTRVVTWHPPDVTSLKVGVDAIVSYFAGVVPGPTLRLVVMGVVLAGLTIWVAMGRREPASERRGWIVAENVGILAALAFLGVILVTRAVFDAQTNPSTRLLYPAFVALLVSAAEWVGLSVQNERGSRLRMAILGLTALALVAATGRVLTEAEDLREEGALVFAEADFQESSPVRFLRGIDDGTEVFSNVPDGLWFAGVDGARPVPITFDPLSFHDSPILDEELARLRSEVESGAVIFYYHPAESSYYLVSLADLEEIAPCIVEEDDLGVVLVDDENPLCET